MQRVTLVALSCRGGMLHYTSQLANELSKHLNVTAIIPEHTEKVLFSPKISIDTIRTGSSLLDYGINHFSSSGVISLIRKIEMSSPEIIHIVSSHPWNFLFTLISRKYPIVFTMHDPKKHSDGLISSLLDISDRVCLKISKNVIVHGECWKKYLINKYKISSAKVSVVNHGDYSFFTKLSGEKELTKNRYVLCFGRIAKYKGLEVLCKAEPIISLVIPDLKICIAGKGDTSLFINDIINREKFEIINRYIAEDEVPSLFKNCQLVVLPYIDATQTGVIPIAYAFHKPVIATKVGAIPEVVEDGVTGYLVPPGDHEALAAAIIKALSEKEKLITMGEAAYKKMEDDLGWAKIVDKTIDIYRNIL